jgi:NAD(P)-dependent dehydrogenase (short-subunit alcohol dehydrogenase family)
MPPMTTPPMKTPPMDMPPMDTPTPDARRVLAGKVAWVTGAGRGFGAGIAEGLALAGARVGITDVGAAELAVTAETIRHAGGTVLAEVVDVTDFDAMQAMADQLVRAWGRLDLIVSNAAIMPLVPFAEHTPEFWQKMIAVNLTGVFHGVRAAWPHLVAGGGGHCIAIASGASLRGFRDEVAYCAAKHGIEGFTKALALEAEPHNIAINTMGPGKRIKPTSITRAEEAALSDAERSQWIDPLLLAPAFAWLAAQPPARFTGLRFDAGPLADTIAAEGYDFTFAPQKVTLYVDDFEQRLALRKQWTGLPERTEV